LHVQLPIYKKIYIFVQPKGPFTQLKMRHKWALSGTCLRLPRGECHLYEYVCENCSGQTGAQLYL